MITELGLPVIYDRLTVDLGYRIDMLVETTVVVEVKAVSKVIPIYQAQLLSHLKLGGYSVGLLMNFHARRLKHGITRMVN